MDGDTHSRSGSASSPKTLSAPEQALADLRFSGELDRASFTPPPPLTNGSIANGQPANGSDDLEGLDPIERLQKELERTKEEKDTLASQYRNLLSKLTTMRTTLGNKLKQDAVCLFNTPFLLKFANHLYA